jgi:hypothetical protein
MSIATITVSDAGAGQIRASVEYSEGYDEESAANIVAWKLMQHLNTLADADGNEEIIGNAPSALVEH